MGEETWDEEASLPPSTGFLPRTNKDRSEANKPNLRGNKFQKKNIRGKFNLGQEDSHSWREREREREGGRKERNRISHVQGGGKRWRG